jgi:hypothetical protein
LSSIFFWTAAAFFGTFLCVFGFSGSLCGGGLCILARLPVCVTLLAIRIALSLGLGRVCGHAGPKSFLQWTRAVGSC